MVDDGSRAAVLSAPDGDADHAEEAPSGEVKALKAERDALEKERDKAVEDAQHTRGVLRACERDLRTRLKEASYLIQSLLDPADNLSSSGITDRQTLKRRAQAFLRHNSQKTDSEGERS